MTDRHFAAGELMFAEGSPSSFVLRVVTGEAEVFKTVDGGEVALGRIRPGDFVGEMGAIQDLPRSASVRAAQDLTAERYDRGAFLRRISEDSPMALRLLTRLSERLSRLSQAYAEMAAPLPIPPATPVERVEAPASGRVTLRAGSDLLAAALPSEPMVLERLPFIVGRVPAPDEAPPALIDLMLDDSRPYRLSPAHFLVAAARGGFEVRDVDSGLGTLVNGEPIGLHFGADAALLRPGENEVVAGGADSQFRFLLTVS